MPLNFRVVCYAANENRNTHGEWLEQHVTHNKGHKYLLLNGSVIISRGNLFAEMHGHEGIGEASSVAAQCCLNLLTGLIGSAPSSVDNPFGWHSRQPLHWLLHPLLHLFISA